MNSGSDDFASLGISAHVGQTEFEAGVGGGLTINNAVDLVLNACNSNTKVNHTPMRPGEEPGAVVEISEQGWKDLEEHINYTINDITPIKDAIESTVEWYKDNLDKFPWDE